MADEEVVEEKEVEKQPEGGEQKDTSDVEALAVKLGWNPNYDGDERAFVSAEDFILRSKEIQNTMSKQLKGTKREIDELKRGIGMLKSHNETVYKVQVKALKSKIRELQTQRKEAVEDGDSSAVTMIDSQIKEINDIPESLPQDQMQPTPPEMVAWMEENEWYTDNEDMKSYADYQGQFNPELKGLPFPKLLKEVAKLVKTKFPEEFPAEKATVPGKADKPKVAAVEGATGRRSGKVTTKNKFSDLSREQQDIAKHLERNSIMTVEEYIADLEKIAEARQ